MDITASTNAVRRDERAIFLPAKMEMNRAMALLKDAILHAIQTGDYSKIKEVCKEDVQEVLNSLTELAYLKGGRRAELSAEKVVNESATEYAPVHFSLRSDNDAQVQGTIDYLRKVSGLDPSSAQDKFEKHNAGAIGDLSKAIVDEVKKAVEDLTVRGVHLKGGKDKIAQILASNNVGVLNASALAETLFRTQSMQAYAAGRWNSAHDKGYGKYIWGFKYITVGDNRVREGHRVLEGVCLPKDDPFWLKYFPPNGWNCRCTTIEIWNGENEAKIDFGITGRDPRKRTAAEMNVPPEFQGNVGILSKIGNEGPKEEPKEKPEKKKPIHVPVKKEPEKPSIAQTPQPETSPAIPTFTDPVHRFWYEVSQYLPQMQVASNPKMILSIVFTNKGLDLKYGNRKKGYLSVWDYEGTDHYTGEFGYKSLRKDEVQNASEALETLREFAATINDIQPQDVQFEISKISAKNLESVVNPPAISINEKQKEKKPRFAKVITRQETITLEELEVALEALQYRKNGYIMRLRQVGRSIQIYGVGSNGNETIFSEISKYSTETTELEK